MSGNINPHKPSLQRQSEIFAAKARELSAAGKTGAASPGNVLAERRCAVGSGENREKAQSAGATIKGLLASLSNSFMGVLHSARSLVKSLSSYTFGPSQPQAALEPKKAMAAASETLAQGVDTITDFLSSRQATKDVYRGARDALSPPGTRLDAAQRQASDAMTDVKSAGQKVIRDAEKFFNKLF